MTFLRLSLVILAICSVTVVSSGKLDKRKHELTICNGNPQEWCLNFTTATQCTAVKHCIDADWSNPGEASLDDSCTTCIQQIQNIRNGIGSNVTKEVIQEVLESVCELTFITRILRKRCERAIDTYVDSHINELLDLLKSDVDPQTICHVLDLCTVSPTEADAGDVAAYYDNIVLHFPATNDLQIFRRMDQESAEPALMDQESAEPALMDEESAEPALLGSKKCTWGPSYWCGNLTTSSECKSTRQCVNKFWSKKKFEEDSDSVCDVCKNMVKQARDELLSNQTQEELKEVLEGSCKLIPLKEVRKECMKLADEFVPELTEVLASQMNPTAVCTVAGLCNSRRIDDLLAAEKKVPALPDLSAMDSCVNCTVAFTAFARFMQSATKDDVLSRMLAVCSELSSYSDLCSSLIVSNLDDIFDLLNTEVPPSAACHLSGMCAFKYHAHMNIDDDDFTQAVDTMLAIRNDDLPCDLCKQLVHHFQEILIANTTEDEFQQMLLGMCQQTGQFRDECTKLVNNNFQVVYKFLTEELDPSKICVDIQICPRSKNFVSDGNLNLISGRVIPVLSYDAKLTNLMPELPQTVTNSRNVDTGVDSIECKFCHTIMDVIQSELKDPKYENDVKKVLKEVCTLVPSSDKDRCDEFIDEYADTLIKVLADETNPFVVCRTLKICPAAAPAVKDNVLCPLCQDILHFIQNSLQDPTDEEEIEKAVEKVCTIVPKAIANKCQEFISQYSAFIVSILSQEVDPSLVCPAMKLCPSASPPKERCAHCRLFMADLLNRLDSNHKLNNIREKVGSLAPIKGLEKSVTAIELRISHDDELIDMMSAEFDEDESCFYMKFCDIETLPAPSSPDVINGDTETNEIIETVTDKPSCKICELFVHIYEKELTSNKTEEEVEDMFNRLCDIIEKPDLKSNCTMMVKKYVPFFLDLLKKNVSPRELCAAAKLCSLRTLADENMECKTCELTVGSLEGLMGDPMMKENIYVEISKICDEMSSPKSHSTCMEVLRAVVPQVIGVVFDIPPWYVCSKMKMCPYGYAIDTSVCSNPKLWCQNKKMAFTCDKLQYCRVNFWSSQAP